jgi:hypothetical protein
LALQFIDELRCEFLSGIRNLSIVFRRPQTQPRKRHAASLTKRGYFIKFAEIRRAQ